MSQSNRAGEANPSWDAGRFLKTLDYFGSIPLLSCLKKMFFGATPPPSLQPQANVLFDFSQTTSGLNQVWGALDDVVMGGVSMSSLQQQNGVAVFAGSVSTANSGGFASVRTRNFEPPLNLGNYSGLELQVQGDGKRYKFLIRDEATWDSVAYAYSFDTVADQWMTVRIPFAQLVPVFRAKTVNTSRPLDASRIRSLQLMLSKFEYDGALNPSFSSGEFRLLLQSIALY